MCSISQETIARQSLLGTAYPLALLVNTPPGHLHAAANSELAAEMLANLTWHRKLHRQHMRSNRHVHACRRMIRYKGWDPAVCPGCRPDVPGNQQPVPQGSRAGRVSKAVAKALVSRLTGAVLWLVQPLLVVFLRILVRSRQFWKRGLSNAWHSRDGVSDELLDAYRLPQLVRGWEVGLVRFVRAQVAGRLTHLLHMPFVPHLLA